METQKKEDIEYQALTEKEKRNLTLLEIIRKRGPVTRSDLSKITGINNVSISNYINSFIDKKLVLERKSDVSSGGRKPEQIILNTDDNCVVGIAVGRGETSGTVVDIGLNVLKKLKAQPADTAGFVEELIKKSSVPKDKMKAVGLAVADPDPSRIANDIKKRTGIETYAGNTPVCAALGESNMNRDADSETMLYVYSDLGYGVMIKEGAFFEKDTYLRPWPAHLGMAEMAKREVAKGAGTAIVDLAKGSMANITGDTVIRAALAKDEMALDIVRSTGLSLGVRVAYLVNLFNPRVIMIGGGIEKAGELILGPMTKAAKHFALKTYCDKFRIIPCALGGDAAMLGAASLAVREIFLKA
jgi:predicted NBD/HSP70 family sugar kinase